MSSYEPAPDTAPQAQGQAKEQPHASATEPSRSAGARHGGQSPARVGTVVWGLIVLALAALIIIGQLGIVVLNGTYVLIGLMIGAGAALVVGGLLSARRRDKETTTGKS
ncbi:hypothetical protein TV39_15530 [Arthrobacter sp. SPG23]|uniref:hypothetical protein n=1 Tax=Arthrobacter sp. SPG23 TaxID=1610703 RepID=UPI0005B93793|nr:hypothetical protein [Arthrobacter sp. SPG23]KIS26675.1 hypothetical protein TV39_15530 [Arthrobacter sp. SPG23]